MKRSEITVIGAGGIGATMAADLTLAGHKVILYELSNFKENVDPIIRDGGITLKGVGRTGFAKIYKVTTDIVGAVKGAKLIVVATVGWAHETIAELCAPHLENGQTLVLISAQLGSFIFKKILKARRPNLDVNIAETVSAPYGSRREIPGTSEAIIRAQFYDLALAALPATETNLVISQMTEFYPNVFTAGKNVLEVGLSNINMLLHPGPILMMTGWIESTGGNMVWWDGLTPSVNKVVEATFKERNAVLEALELKDTYSFDKFKKLISDPETRRLTGPRDMNHRFITEDCPMGLVSLTCFGDLVGVAMPVCKAIVTLISQIIGVDYFKEGRNLERLELSGMSPRQLIKYVTEGEGYA